MNTHLEWEIVRGSVYAMKRSREFLSVFIYFFAEILLEGSLQADSWEQSRNP